jgi:cyclopropane-fatty-acyl-phospholipid synthase
MNPDNALSSLPAAGRHSLFRRALSARLERLAEGSLELRTSDGVEVFGSAHAGALSARLEVRNDRFFRRLALGGTLGAAESFMDGDWTSGDLTTLIRLLLRNGEVTGALESGSARYGAVAARVWGALRRNTRAGSKRNISEHYDLGNEFFAKMLDPTLTYSSGVYPSPDATLEQASRHKLDLVCQKLALKPGDQLLEIGTGWGSLALHAAERFGARVTTTTISREQHRVAAARIEQAGLGSRVTLLERDYRDLEGRFDKLVSIEMIEAVGADYYDAFFGQCARLLVPGGRFALQSITIVDQKYDRHRHEIDFIKRYVFPGSTIPSVTALLASATRSSDLRLVGLDDYGSHYARTLAAWRANLEPHRAWVTATYGERFWRLWAFYLAYCEAGFAEGYISVAQMLFERPQWRQP